MILIPKSDVIVTVAVSVDDMPQQPTEMKLKNLQTKEVTTWNLTDMSTTQRTAIYLFYNIRTSSPTPVPFVTYFKLQDGMYEYEIGSEIGLLQVGIPALDKQTYNGQSNTNRVYYNG